MSGTDRLHRLLTERVAIYEREEGKPDRTTVLVTLRQWQKKTHRAWERMEDAAQNEDWSAYAKGLYDFLSVGGRLLLQFGGAKDASGFDKIKRRVLRLGQEYSQ